MDINEAADTGAAEQRVTEPSGLARRRLIVGGATGAALSLVPFLMGRASAGNSSGLPTAGSSDGTFTDNSTDSFENSPSVNSTDAGSTTGTGDATVGTDPTANSGANGSNSGSQGGGYSGTGDSTNSPTGNSTDDSTGGSVDPTGDSTDGSTDATGDTEPATTTTTAPPKRPTGDDEMLLSFAQSLELTTYDLYQQAIDLNTFTGVTLEAIRAIAESHQAYGQAISGFLGRNAPNENVAALFNDLKDGFTGDEQAVATAARELENTLVATHIDIVGQLLGVDGSALIASVLVVEARHATVLARIAGIVDLDDQLTTEGEPLAADDFAVANG